MQNKCPPIHVRESRELHYRLSQTLVDRHGDAKLASTFLPCCRKFLPGAEWPSVEQPATRGQEPELDPILEQTPPFDVRTVSLAGEVTQVAIRGEVDISTASQLWEHLDVAIPRATHRARPQRHGLHRLDWAWRLCAGVQAASVSRSRARVALPAPERAPDPQYHWSRSRDDG